MDLLKTLLATGVDAYVPKPLRSLLHTALGDNWKSVKLEAILAKQAQSKLADEAIKQVGRALTKQIDSVVSAKAEGTTVADRGAVANALAKEGALALCRCAELLLQYPKYQQAVENDREKERNDAASIAARKAAQDALHAALRDVLRAVGSGE